MEEKILEILKDINEDLLTYSGDNMLDDGIVNSFSFISLISELEEEFDVEIDEEFYEAEYLGNKNRIISTIKMLCSK
ncbi:hypothetical protein [Butyrivibrio sp. FC2001]|uniref:hypothetical protein n=1 Tax=Butyrivibrio sp. FC2001 TaxID=1280671 RepID=UPI00042442FD|nr:hypothetical protein [Butyrivibrio sp. FC2001]